MPAVEHSSRPRSGEPSRKNRRPLAITVAALLFLLALIWSATLWDISRSEKEVQSTIEITTLTLARALSEHMMSTVKRLELVARELDDAWAPTGNEIIEEANRIKKNVDDLAIQITIVEPTGVVRYSTLPFVAGVSIADREHFKVHLAPPWREMFVGKPVLGRVSGKWTIQFSSPIVRNDTLVGVIVLSVEPDYFASFFRSLGLDPLDLIDVVRSDGALLVRSTDDGLIYGHVISGTSYLKENAPVSGNFRRPSQIDGIERIFGYYKLGQYGLIFVVGSAVQNAFVPYEQIREVILWGSSLISIMLVALGLLAYDSVRRLEAANHKLEEISVKDYLTGVFNRRHFDETLQKEVGRLAREGGVLCVAMVDVDNFKLYNDVYGHLAGDNCLACVAKAMGAVLLRPADEIFRYGGEEFAIVMPQTGREQALGVAERVREAVSDLRIPHCKSAFGHVTISIGVAAIDAANAVHRRQACEELIRVADKALYRAKNGGRNKVDCGQCRVDATD